MNQQAFIPLLLCCSLTHTDYYISLLLNLVLCVRSSLKNKTWWLSQEDYQSSRLSWDYVMIIQTHKWIINSSGLKTFLQTLVILKSVSIISTSKIDILCIILLSSWLANLQRGSCKFLHSNSVFTCQKKPYHSICPHIFMQVSVRLQSLLTY